jgi:peptide chain release factor 2
LQAQVATPDFWTDGNHARSVLAEINVERALVEPYETSVRELEDIPVFLELARESSPADMPAALKEADAAILSVTERVEKLELQTLLSGRMDANNAYLIFHAGAGGTESCDWAQMLVRMYTRWCERNGFSFSCLDSQPGDEAGIKSATFLISGPYAYGYLKGERGVHRLVRISPFDSNKRRHTSFVALDVTAELEDDVEIVIDDRDLRVDTYRSGGSGGQHVNKTDSAVRIVHLPTGIVVSCQAERSQHTNRDKCMRMLKARLYEYEQDKKRKDMEQFYGAKGEIAWGHQIRSYVLQPYTLVKDHRTDLEIGNVADVLDGAVTPFIQRYMRQSAKESAGAPSDPAS